MMTHISCYRFTYLLWLYVALGIFQLSALSGQESVEANDVEQSYDPNYQISAGDLLEVKVFRHEDASARVRVSKDGKVSLPYIGVTHVGRLTPESAARRIEAALLDGYLVKPQVNVTVLSYSKIRFTVRGQVRQPGSFENPLNKTITLLDAIGRAGGVTDIANERKVLVKRTVAGREVIYTIDTVKMATGDGTNAFIIQDGDVITVKESFF